MALFGLFGDKPAYIEAEVKAKAPSEPNGDLALVESRQEGVFKTYIPGFLYKPPFGYPRAENLPLIRQMARNPYVYSIIKSITDAIATADWDIVKKENIDYDVDEQIEKVKQFFLNPNGNMESFSDILRAVTRDILEIDSGVIVKVFNPSGELVQIFARDGGSFLKNPNIYGYIGDRDDYVAPVSDMELANLSETDRIHFYELNYRESAAYFQYGFTSQSMPIPFGKNEIVYIMQNPRTDSIYGQSPVAILTDIILTLVYGSQYNLDFYMNNNMPEGIMSIPGASPEELKAFKNRFESQFRKKDEITGFWRKIGFKFPFTNREASFIPFQLDPKTMQVIEQQTWFTKIAWSAFGLTADEMGFCYSEDTRVLTNSGLKYHYELTEDDKIATVNEQSHEIEYVIPTAIHTFNVKDRHFHHYKNSRVDTLVSADHRMYYRTLKCDDYRMSPSEDIDVNTINVLQGGLDWKGEFIDKIIIEKVEYNNNKHKNKFTQLIEFDINEYCEFLGYYLSEGSISKDMDKNKQYWIKISQTKKEGVEIMTPLMDRLGFRRQETCWVLNNKSLAKHLSKFGKAHDKYITEEIKNLPKEQLRILFDALIVGDGCILSDNSIRYSSSSKRLAEDVLEIALKLGYTARVKKQVFENVNWRDHYVVSITKNHIEPRIVISSQREDISYTGVMWCPSVYNRPFITERNGCLSIHYNTENSNKAVGEVQSEVGKRKAIKPLMKLIEYHINQQIIPEFGTTDVRFKFDNYDVDAEMKKYDLYMKQQQVGVMTPEMVAEKEGIDVAQVKEAQDEQKEMEMMKITKPSASDGKKSQMQEDDQSLFFIGDKVKVISGTETRLDQIGTIEEFTGDETVVVRFEVGKDIFNLYQLVLIETNNTTQGIKAKDPFNSTEVEDKMLRDIFESGKKIRKALSAMKGDKNARI